jgi:hypothetical protein
MSVIVERIREHREYLPGVNHDLCHWMASDVDLTGSVGRFPNLTVKPQSGGHHG